MLKERLFYIFAVLSLVAGLSALPAKALADGVSWLQAQANLDGSISSSTDLASPDQATAETLRSFYVLDQSALPEAQAALQFLNTTVFHNTESLAQRIIVNNAGGMDVSVLLAELRNMQNRDGGFGELAGYDSTVLDTLHALQAFAEIGDLSSENVSRAIGYLLDRQKSDGGWEDGQNSSSIFVTAAAAVALSPYRDKFAGASSALTGAVQYLLSERGAGGLWNSDFESAYALLALNPLIVDNALLGAIADALRARQTAAGSWSNDVYSTALALRALAAYDGRAVNSQSTAGITGVVMLSGSGEPIAGAIIRVSGKPGLTVTTNGSGIFSLLGLPPGKQTLVVEKAGFDGSSRVVTLNAAQVLNAGEIFIAPTVQSGSLFGHVFDSRNGKALAGAEIVLTGAVSYRASTDAAGGFDMVALQPGSYQIGVSKAGFTTVSGSIDIPAGVRLQINQSLVPEGGFADSTPGTLSGTVLDGETGEPLDGVVFSLAGGGRAVSGASGIFILPDVARGSHTATLSASGYQERQFNILFPAGAAGKLGSLLLYRSRNVAAPNSLTLYGTVVSGLDGKPVAGATIELVETGAQVGSDANGEFVIPAIVLNRFSLRFSAAGYSDATYDVAVNAFGEVAETFRLSPAVAVNPAVTSSTLAGVIRDAATSQPVSGARVEIPVLGLSAVADAAGQYRLSGIGQLEFSLSVSAPGYDTPALAVKLSNHSNYTLDIEMNALPDNPQGASLFQVVSITPTSQSVAGNTTANIGIEIANLTTTPQQAQILAQVVDAQGTAVATLTPYAPGTTLLQSSFAFAPQQSLKLIMPWDVAQNLPGGYRIAVRVIEPGSITRANPLGRALATGEGYLTVTETTTFDGVVVFDPPITQAGSVTPVSISVLLINKSNVDLLNEDLVLTIRDPDSGAVLHSAMATVSRLPVAGNVTVDFGPWLPTRSGNLPVEVVPNSVSLQGKVLASLYVGDKASGTFTVDRNVVPEGDQTVRGRITLTGVDARTGTGTDPLFLAVREAVRKGGEYVAANGMAWHKRNRCLGCHIQTQSLVGLGTSLDKAPIDRLAANTLFNAVASSLQNDGGLYLSHPNYGRTQTVLGVWALSEWPDRQRAFRPLYHALNYLHARRSSSGDRDWISPDHSSGWWRYTDVSTALVAKGFATVLHTTEMVPDDQLQLFNLSSGVSLQSGREPVDVEAGSDGMLYILQASGDLIKYNPLDQQTSPVFTGLSLGTVRALALAGDGSFYVAADGAIHHLQSDGSYVTLAAGLGDVRDIETAHDGSLYASDYSGNRILRINLGGQVEVLASGGLLSNPHGLALANDGNLYVANYTARNLLKIEPSGSVTVFADDLGGLPRFLVQDGSGGLFVSHGPYRTTSAGVMYVAADGTVDRLFGMNNPQGIAVLNTDVYVLDSGRNQISAIMSGSYDVMRLDAYRDSLRRMMNFLLSRYMRGESNNVIHAGRLIGLAEGRRVIRDAALNARIDAAITVIANLLKSRQRGDGGWGVNVSSGSDPMVTALVGIALDYTSPSADEPFVRNTIQYLLSTQQADKSWPSYSGLLSTRLASTSLVMAYMPKALDRLGGIDTDFYLTLPANVALSNPALRPATTTTNADGSVTHYWRLQGVTSNSRLIEFDLNLAAMQLHESRQVADAAWIEFENSFNNDLVRVDLTVPSVKATSELGLGVDTNRPAYRANEDVAITATVSNTAPVTGSGRVALRIIEPGSGIEVAQVADLPVDNLGAGASIDLSASWNTGDVAPGAYQVVGRLHDRQGRLLTEATVPFTITQDGIIADSGVSTDKPEYTPWETVLITGRLRNISANMILPGTHIGLEVSDPSGAAIYMETIQVNELTPGVLRDLPFTLVLDDAPAGDYPITLTVRDDFTRNLLSSSTTTFRVVRSATAALAGQVEVDPRRVYQGDSALCTEQIFNRSGQALAGVRLTRRLLSVTSGTVLNEQVDLLDMPGNGQTTRLYNIDTSNLPLGEYYCVLSGEVNGVSTQLAAAGFQVVPPPIRIDASLAAQGKGRLLVLLPGDCHEDDKKHHAHDCKHGHDDEDDKGDDGKADGKHADRPHGPVPAVSEQLALLTRVLDAAGWSYTIVNDTRDFVREFRSGGYAVYALLGGHKKLVKDVQKELREAVNRGEGLLVSGWHDERNHALAEVLGVKYKGKHARASNLSILDSPVSMAASQALAYADHVTRAEATTAQLVATYDRLQDDGDDSRHDDENRDERKGHDDRDGKEDHHAASRLAVALNEYGLGRAVFAGFDLLAHATATGDAALLDDLLVRTLAYVHPQILAAVSGRVVPLTLTLTNQGIATPGRVVLTLPDSVTVVDPGQGTPGNRNTLIWPFALAADQVVTRQAWVRLPAGGAPLEFSALIQTGAAPDWKDYDALTLNLAPQVPASLGQAIARLDTLNGDKHIRKARKALREADEALQKNDYDEVLEEVLDAIDHLIESSASGTGEVRLLLDGELARIAMLLPPDSKHD